MLKIILGSKYFVIQSLLLLSYLAIRYYYLNKTILNAPEWLGYTRESIIVTMLIIFMLIRYKQFHTTEHFLNTFFFFGKVCAFFMIHVAGNYTILAYYILACLFAWLLVKPGSYKGKSNLIDINETQYNQILNNKSNKINGSYIFLVAYAPFSETCFTVN